LAQVTANLKKQDLSGRKADLWHYRELLPVKDPANIVTLGEGMTPLLRLKRLGLQVGMPNLYLKDKDVIPTGTLKARGVAVEVSRAKALGGFLVLQAVYETGGCAVAVAYSDLLEAEARLAASEGAFIRPEEASNLHAAMVLREKGWIKSEERVVPLNTGSGLKYPETVTVEPCVLNPEDDLPPL
jgi:threonine synthase